MDKILELTDDREVHFKPYKLKKLKAIHVWHVDITDNQIKHVPIFPHHPHRDNSLIRRRRQKHNNRLLFQTW